MRSFCLTLLYTGARISEVLGLVPTRIDPVSGVVIIRSLKKRRDNDFRAVPVPQALLEELAVVSGAKAAQINGLAASHRIWPWSRTFAWQVVKDVMRDAGIAGPHAVPKGLRHGFAVEALQSGVPINVVSKWLGHARIETTAIYTEVTGKEERFFAEKMWQAS